jgi:hypothetical protein
MPVSVCSLNQQTFLVVGRHPNQKLWVGGVEYITEVPEHLLRIYGSGLVELGSGWWDCVAVIDGQYDGPWFDANNPPPGMSSRWSGSENNSESLIGFGGTTQFTLENQTFLIKARDDSQKIFLSGSVRGHWEDDWYRAYGTGSVTLGPGYWDQMMITDGRYLVPWMNSRQYAIIEHHRTLFTPTNDTILMKTTADKRRKMIVSATSPVYKTLALDMSPFTTLDSIVVADIGHISTEGDDMYIHREGQVLMATAISQMTMTVDVIYEGGTTSVTPTTTTDGSSVVITVPSGVAVGKRLIKYVVKSGGWTIIEATPPVDTLPSSFSLYLNVL